MGRGRDDGPRKERAGGFGRLRPRTPQGPGFFVTSLDAFQRWQIVTNSANFHQTGAAYLDVTDFELSPLGADLSLQGNWPESSSNLLQWVQETSQGRDHYVKTVERGYLFPTGHRAAMITVVQRDFVPDPDGSSQTVAYLQSITYIRVLEQMKTYPAPGQAFDAKSWPFVSCYVATKTSPYLFQKPPGPLVKFTGPGGKAVSSPISGWGYPVYGPSSSELSNVTWHLVLTDLAGRTVSVRTPLAFVEGVPLTGSEGPPNYPHTQYDESATFPICQAYNDIAITDAEFPRELNIGGRPITFALEADGHPGGTTHPTLAIFLGAGTTIYDPATSKSAPATLTGPGLYAIDQPAFYPVVQTARVRLSAAETLSQGTLDDSDDPLNIGGVGIKPYAGYVEMATATGYTSSNKGNVFAALTAPPTLGFGNTQTVGGIGTPNTQLQGLSASAGPVGGPGGLDSYASSGAIHPAAYFKGLTSQILGGLPLSGLLKKFVNPFNSSDSSPPVTPAITDETDPSTGVRTVLYSLQAQLMDNALVDAIQFQTGPGGNGMFTMNAVWTIPPTGQSSYVVKGSIDPFTIDIVVLSVPFTSMTFTAQSGTKPDVVTQIGNVTFEGPLSFLNALEQFVQDLGGDGFTITVTPSGVMASFSISLPNIGLGVVNIQGLGMTAGVSIPFLGGPMLAQFGFASEANPFTVTVMCFGGGGYFLAGFGIYGMQQLTVSIQFEGQLALNLGVASGGVSLSAGFTFSLDDSTPPGTTKLTAFVEIDGYVQVLGIITISLSLDITLTYAVIGSQSYLTGTATMKASVSIGPFGITVPITVQKQFAGGSGGGAALPLVAGPALEPHDGTSPPAPPYPAFGDVFSSDTTWAGYCSSFAG